MIIDRARIEELWGKASTSGHVPLEAFPESFRVCLTQGDGLADHYAGRTPFLFADQRNNRILVLEKLAPGREPSVRVFDAINCTGGYGTGILGSQVSALEHDLVEALHHCATANDEFHTIERYELVTQIRRLIGAHTGTSPETWEISFTSTGTEAMDLAMQLVMLDGFDLGTGRNSRQERDVLIACHGAWHGWGLNPNQLLDRRQFTEGLPRLGQHRVVFMRYGDEASLREVFELHRGRIRGVFVEGILGDGGVVRGSESWWKALFELASTEDAKIVDDEILTGFRCGRFLAIPEQLTPDCVALGKAMGLGLFPLSAVLWRKDRLHLRPGIGVRTFNARPFQARVVSAGLALIEEQKLFERARVVGERVMAKLQDLARSYPAVFKGARGMGFFFGLELDGRYARKGHSVRNMFLRHGVLTEIESGLLGRQVPKQARINETIRLTPPLGIAESDLDEVIERMSRAAAVLASESPEP